MGAVLCLVFDPSNKNHASLGTFRVENKHSNEAKLLLLFPVHFGIQ
jgi:hypothetical protein